MLSRKLIYSSLLVLIPFLGFAQQDGYKWRLNAGAGNSYNQWNLSGKNGPSAELMSIKKDYLTYQLSIERLLGDAWGTELMVFSLPGTFDYREIDLLLNYYSDNRKLGYRNRFMSPFLSIGVGRDQIEEEITLPYGGGLKFRIAERLNLNIEYLARVSPSDWSGRVGVASLTLGYNFKKRKITFNAPPIYASSSTNYLNDIVEPVYLASDSSGKEFNDFDSAYMLLMDSVGNDSLKEVPDMRPSDLTDSAQVQLPSDSLVNTWTADPDSIAFKSPGGAPFDSVHVSQKDSVLANKDLMIDELDPTQTRTQALVEPVSKVQPTLLQPGQSASGTATESVVIPPAKSTTVPFETMPPEKVQSEYVPKYQSSIQSSPLVGSTPQAFSVLPGSAEISAREVSASGSYTLPQSATVGMFARMGREQDSIKQYLTQQIEIQKLQIELSRMQTIPATSANKTESAITAQQELAAERNTLYLEKIAFLEQKLSERGEKAIRDTIVLQTTLNPAQEGILPKMQGTQQLPQKIKSDSTKSVAARVDSTSAIAKFERDDNVQLKSRVDSLQDEVMKLSAQLQQLKAGLRSDDGRDTVIIRQSPEVDNVTRDELLALKKELDLLKTGQATKPESVPESIDTRFDEQFKVLASSTVYFATSSYELTQLSKAVLEPVSTFVLDNPSLKIILSGYTDKTGSPEKNQLLSKKRAEAVANYFRDKGIVSDRISITFHGPDSTSNESPAYGRRVEILLN